MTAFVTPQEELEAKSWELLLGKTNKPNKTETFQERQKRLLKEIFEEY